MQKDSNIHDEYQKLLKKHKKSLDKAKKNRGELTVDFSAEIKVPLGTNFDGGGFRRARPDELN